MSVSLSLFDEAYQVMENFNIIDGSIYLSYNQFLKFKAEVIHGTHILIDMMTLLKLIVDKGLKNPQIYEDSLLLIN